MTFDVFEVEQCFEVLLAGYDNMITSGFSFRICISAAFPNIFLNMTLKNSRNCQFDVSIFRACRVVHNYMIIFSYSNALYTKNEKNSGILHRIGLCWNAIISIREEYGWTSSTSQLAMYVDSFTFLSSNHHVMVEYIYLSNSKAKK